MGKSYKPNPEYNRKTKSKIGGGDWWDPQRGVKNMFRVAPPFDSRGICIIRRVLHYGLEEDGRRRAFPCLADNEPWLPSSPCILDHIVQKLMMGDKDEQEIAKELDSSSPRFVVQGADCNNPDKGVIKWAGPVSFGKYFIGLLEDSEVEDPTDPDVGYDIIIEISGKGRGTKYDYRMRPKSTPFPVPGWSDMLVDLIKTNEVRNNTQLKELVALNYGNVIDLDVITKDFTDTGSVAPSTEDKPSYTEDDIEKMSDRQRKKLAKSLDIEDGEWKTQDELIEILIDELDAAPF